MYVFTPWFFIFSFFLLLARRPQTGADYTIYPFATQNAQDFANLLSVYADAAFFPRLRVADFWQEGHRVEWASSADADAQNEAEGRRGHEGEGEEEEDADDEAGGSVAEVAAAKKQSAKAEAAPLAAGALAESAEKRLVFKGVRCR